MERTTNAKWIFREGTKNIYMYMYICVYIHVSIYVRNDN